MTLTEAKDLAAIASFGIAAVSLVFVAYNTRLTFKTNRARFWLDLRSAFLKHDEVHQKLRPGGEWSDGSGPRSADDMSKVESYMGLFEHCEIMIENDLIDASTFREVYLFRIHNLMANDWVRVEKICKRPAGWKRFIALLGRMKLKYSCD